MEDIKPTVSLCRNKINNQVVDKTNKKKNKKTSRGHVSLLAMEFLPIMEAAKHLDALLENNRQTTKWKWELSWEAKLLIHWSISVMRSK